MSKGDASALESRLAKLELIVGELNDVNTRMQELSDGQDESQLEMQGSLNHLRSAHPPDGPPLTVGWNATWQFDY